MTNLKQAIKTLKTIVPTKAYLPVLEYVLLETSDTSVIISGTSLNTYARIALVGELSTATTKKLWVKFKDFYTAVKSFKNPSFRISDNILVINDSINITGELQSEAFDSLESQIKNRFFSVVNCPLTLKHYYVHTALKNCLSTASVDQTRYNLHGVHVNLSDNTLVIESADGHRLTQTALHSHYGKLDVLLSLEFAKVVADIAPNETRISFEENKTIYASTVEYIVGINIDGQFPDTSAVIPKTFKNEIKNISRDSLLALVEKTLILADKKLPRIELSAYADHLHVSIENSKGKFSGSLQCETLFQTCFIVGLNGQYLKDFLKTSDKTSSISIKFSNDTSPIQFNNSETLDELTIIMPLRK